MSVSPLAVLPLDTGRPWRGGQQQVLLLHRHLLALGVDSTVLAPAASPLLTACRDLGLAAAALAGRRPWAGLVAPFASRGGRVLHAHDSHAVGIAALAHGAHGGAVVAHRRVSYPPGRLGWRLKYRAVARWIAVSTEIAAQLSAAGARPGTVRVVPSAVDLERFTARGGAVADLDLEADAPVVALVGFILAQRLIKR